MKISYKLIVIALLIVTCVSGFAQSRKNQWEFYGGAAFPLGPDEFKDFYKVGISGNIQYVLFVTPNLGIPIFVGFEGFTVDNDAISDFFSDNIIVDYPIVDTFSGNLIGYATGGTLETEGTASTGKIGIGLRPYLTSMESSTQFFLFGSVIYNAIRDEQKINGGTIDWEDFSGNPDSFELTDQDVVNVFGNSKFKNEDEKFGIAAGAGFELPAGPRLNLIIQGLFNMIFTEEDPTTFIGVTAGLVF